MIVFQWHPTVKLSLNLTTLITLHLLPFQGKIGVTDIKRTDCLNRQTLSLSIRRFQESTPREQNCSCAFLLSAACLLAFLISPRGERKEKETSATDAFIYVIYCTEELTLLTFLVIFAIFKKKNITYHSPTSDYKKARYRLLLFQ